MLMALPATMSTPTSANMQFWQNFFAEHHSIPHWSFLKGSKFGLLDLHHD
jgi:hypothetical protein